MVWFQCEDCGDTIKKPKLDSHFRQCRASRFTCIDCLLVFDRQSVKYHTSCVTEHEKYAEGATKPGGYAAGGFNATVSGSGAAAGSAEPVGLEHCTSRPPWRCNLCGVNCTSRENLNAHAASKKHRNKYKRVTSAMAQGDQGAETSGRGLEEAAAAPKARDPATEEVSPASKEGDGLSDEVSRELSDWSKHTKKLLKKKGGQSSVKKLGKLVLKRIVKKSQAKKISSAQKKLIESKWLKKLAKSSHFVIEGDEVVLKKIF